MSPPIRCPFLFQTQTILRQHIRPRLLQQTNQKRSNTFSPTNNQDSLEPSQPSPALSFLQKKAQDVHLRKQSKPTSAPTSNITTTTTSTRKRISTPDPSSPTTISRPQNPDLDPNLILQLFSHRNNHHEPSNLFLPDRDQATAVLSEISTTFQSALHSPTTAPDHAIWKLYTERILPTMPMPPSPPPPQQQQQDPLHPQLYPSALLLLLRLLTTHHPTSPVALSLLPYTRSLGPRSYQLGAANVHFYNELMALYWRVYSDLASVDGLLGEMEREGIEFDVGTLEALRAVGEERRRDMRKGNGGGEEGGKGGRGAAWWGRQEVRRTGGKVDVWRRVVARRLAAKGIGVAEREGEGDDGDDVLLDGEVK